MNVRLLRRIAKVIQEKPEQFAMANWHRDCTKTFGVAIALCELPKAQALSPKRDCNKPAEVDAMRLLDLTSEQAERLFYVVGSDGQWPKQFMGRKGRGNDIETDDRWHPTARQAAARIEHFIATKGTE